MHDTPGSYRSRVEFLGAFLVQRGRGGGEENRRATPVLLRERAIATSYREEKLGLLEIIAIFSIGRHVNAGVIEAGN